MLHLRHFDIQLDLHRIGRQEFVGSYAAESNTYKIYRSSNLFEPAYVYILNSHSTVRHLTEHLLISASETEIHVYLRRHSSVDCGPVLNVCWSLAKASTGARIRDTPIAIFPTDQVSALPISGGKLEDQPKADRYSFHYTNGPSELDDNQESSPCFLQDFKHRVDFAVASVNRTRERSLSQDVLVPSSRDTELRIFEAGGLIFAPDVRKMILEIGCLEVPVRHFHLPEYTSHPPVKFLLLTERSFYFISLLNPVECAILKELEHKNYTQAQYLCAEFGLDASVLFSHAAAIEIHSKRMVTAGLLLIVLLYDLHWPEVIKQISGISHKGHQLILPDMGPNSWPGSRACLSYCLEQLRRNRSEDGSLSAFPSLRNWDRTVVEEIALRDFLRDHPNISARAAIDLLLEKGAFDEAVYMAMAFNKIPVLLLNLCEFGRKNHKEDLGKSTSMVRLRFHYLNIHTLRTSAHEGLSRICSYYSLMDSNTRLSKLSSSLGSGDLNSTCSTSEATVKLRLNHEMTNAGQLRQIPHLNVIEEILVSITCLREIIFLKKSPFIWSAAEYSLASVIEMKNRLFYETSQRRAPTKDFRLQTTAENHVVWPSLTTLEPLNGDKQRNHLVKYVARMYKLMTMDLEKTLNGTLRVQFHDASEFPPGHLGNKSQKYICHESQLEPYIVVATSIWNACVITTVNVEEGASSLKFWHSEQIAGNQDLLANGRGSHILQEEDFTRKVQPDLLKSSASVRMRHIVKDVRIGCEHILILTREGTVFAAEDNAFEQDGCANDVPASLWRGKGPSKGVNEIDDETLVNQGQLHMVPLPTGVRASEISTTFKLSACLTISGSVYFWNAPWKPNSDCCTNSANKHFHTTGMSRADIHRLDSTIISRSGDFPVLISCGLSHILLLSSSGRVWQFDQSISSRTHFSANTVDSPSVEVTEGVAQGSQRTKEHLKLVTLQGKAVYVVALDGISLALVRLQEGNERIYGWGRSDHSFFISCFGPLLENDIQPSVLELAQWDKLEFPKVPLAKTFLPSIANLSSMNTLTSIGKTLLGHGMDHFASDLFLVHNLYTSALFHTITFLSKRASSLEAKGCMEQIYDIFLYYTEYCMPLTLQ
ncbi:unnamed protein product [Calicophoron daubneyi]|uniref:Uncharacterized protein n=1 Tax=Calicophoron daubneyi TaxID=300641 RepID=A0AAV2TUL7_CALDB